MKTKIGITFLLLVAILFAQAQEKKEIRVKITRLGSTLVDTSFIATENDFEETITDLLSEYTDELVYINSENMHSLYVFDVSGRENKKDYHRDITLDLDEIFEKFGDNIEQAWDDFDMDDFMDTATVRAKKLHKNMRQYKATVDPELQKLKRELQEAVDKMRATRIIIIEDGDTIRIPKK